MRTLLLASVLLAAGPAPAEEAFCTARAPANGDWPSPRCEPGDVLALHFDDLASKMALDPWHMAAVMCEPESITLFKDDRVLTLLCRYHGHRQLRWILDQTKGR